MQRLLLASVLTATWVGVAVHAQTPAPPPTQGRPTQPAAPAPARPATPQGQSPAAPATPAPAPRRPAAPAPATRGGLVIFVTDMTGAPIRDVRVQAVGPTERGGTTDGGGRLTITGMQAGTYRLRFTNDAFTEFEREVVVRGGPNTEVDVSLRPAPPPKVVTVTEAAPPPPPAAPTVGPLGQPQTIAAIATLVTKEFLTGPRREAMISCSGNTRLALVQMTEEQPVRLYENAEVMYYVLGGEGVARVAGRETILKQESLVFLPRGTSHSLSHRGRRNVPLILVSVLSGEPCEQAR